VQAAVVPQQGGRGYSKKKYVGEESKLGKRVQRGAARGKGEKKGRGVLKGGSGGGDKKVKEGTRGDHSSKPKPGRNDGKQN